MKNPISQKHRPLIAMVALALFLFFVSAFQVIGAEGQSPQKTAGGKTYPFQNTSNVRDNSCEPEMKEFAFLEIQDFLSFLEKNFQNKSSTASLLEISMGKYREMRHELYTAYSKYSPNKGALILSTGLQPGACLKIVEDTLGDARVLLQRHVMRTSGVKKSTALLQKYQQINTQLQTLNQQFANMKAYLDSFSSKLPCYIKAGSCVKG